MLQRNENVKEYKVYLKRDPDSKPEPIGFIEVPEDTLLQDVRGVLMDEVDCVPQYFYFDKEGFRGNISSSIEAVFTWCFAVGKKQESKKSISFLARSKPGSKSDIVIVEEYDEQDRMD